MKLCVTLYRKLLPSMKTNKRITMKANELQSFDVVFNGEVVAHDQEQHQKQADVFCYGQIIREARKYERVTQTELAKRIGANKSYISKIESGAIEPRVSVFFRIIEVLGLRVDIVKPIY